jgi:hypothetical protein
MPQQKETKRPKGSKQPGQEEQKGTRPRKSRIASPAGNPR